MFQNTNFLTH